MRIAIIDLGTNSVRFDVHQLGPGKHLKTLHREKIMVRLGQGVFEKGVLDRSAVGRTLSAFKKFKQIIDFYGVKKVRAFGTSALREVRDGEAFAQKIFRQTGIEIQIISGTEEARLIAQGVLSLESITQGKVALIDIGGGSTEISICRGKKIVAASSFPLGTARLQQLYLRGTPPKKGQIESLRKQIQTVLYPEVYGNRWPKVARVIGSSGTIRTLGRILGEGKSQKFQLRELTPLVDAMSRMTTTELLAIEGMEAKRVDMIVAGAVLFEECMKVTGAKWAQPTEYSLRDGILLEERAVYQNVHSSRFGVHLLEFAAVAKKYNTDPKYIKNIENLARSVFLKLRHIHGLPPANVEYLVVAAMLREIGQFIGPTQIGAHSAYLVENTPLPTIEDQEHKLLRDLVFWHDHLKIDLKKMHSAQLDRRFWKLLALLKIVDSLDPGINGHCVVNRVSTGQGEVVLHLKGRGLTGLESSSLGSQQDFFKKSLGKQFNAKRAAFLRTGT